jgi:hypothetical protein
MMASPRHDLLLTVTTLHSSKAKQSKAKQSKAKQSKAQQSKAKQSKAQQSKAQKEVDTFQQTILQRQNQTT